MAQNPGYSPTKYFYLKRVLSLIFSNHSVVYFLRAPFIKENKVRKNQATVMAMMEAKEISSIQKYRVLEEHFRCNISDELSYYINKLKDDENTREFVPGIRYAQNAILGVETL